MAAASATAGSDSNDPSALPTSTKWSVLSSRVEGLVAELAEVVGKQDAYCVSVSRAEGPAMAAVREKMLATPWGDLWAQKKTMFSYGEEMSTDPLVAMLEGSSESRVVSLEIDPYLKGWVADCLKGF